MASKLLTLAAAAASLPFLSQRLLLHPVGHQKLLVLNPRKTFHSLNLKMSWACKKCTFLNPQTPSPKPSCQICLAPQSPSPPPESSSSIAKWPCKACTFLNPYKNSSCEVCGTRAPISSLSSFEDFNDSGFDSGGVDSSVGSVFLPLQRCKKRARVELDDDDPVEVVQSSSKLSKTDDKGTTVSSSSGFNLVQKVEASEKVVALSGSSGFNGVRKVSAPEKDMALKRCTSSIVEGTSSGSSGVGLNTLKILSYNVWFREDLELHSRMRAIGNLIQQHCPDVICFQEVTPDIYDVFQKSHWWKMYQCSVSNKMAESSAYFCMQLTKLRLKSFSCKPFGYSAMGRQLCVAEVEAQEDKHLVVATSHLESPCPGPPKWDQMYSEERVAQAKEAVDFLKKHKNVIFCGDMNWCDKLDGQFPLPDKWVDAWEQLRPGEDGWTYDTKSNKMLTGNRSLRKRLDRFLCSLHDFKVSKIEMVGMDAIPGVSYIKEKKVKGEIKELMLPVLPSDHYGLLLTISGA